MKCWPLRLDKGSVSLIMSSESNRVTKGETAGIKHPTKRDVLLGRGAACWNHSGNKWFREIIAANLSKYETCKIRVEKMVIVSDIVKQIFDADGRFLKKDLSSDNWYTVDRKTAIEKTGHAIRDKRAVEQKREYKEMQAREFLRKADLALAQQSHINRHPTPRNVQHGRSTNYVRSPEKKNPWLSSSDLETSRVATHIGYGSKSAAGLPPKSPPGWSGELEHPLTPGDYRHSIETAFDNTRDHTLSTLSMSAHPMPMGQYTHELMASSRSTDQALDSISRQTERTQSALWSLREISPMEQISPVARWESDRGVGSVLDEMRRTSNLASSTGNHPLFRSLPPLPLELPDGPAYYQRAQTEQPFFQEPPSMDQTATFDIQTQTALRALQATLGDEETANAIRRACMIQFNTEPLQEHIMLPGPRIDHLGQRNTRAGSRQISPGSPDGAGYWNIPWSSGNPT